MGQQGQGNGDQAGDQAAMPPSRKRCAASSAT